PEGQSGELPRLRRGGGGRRGCAPPAATTVSSPAAAATATWRVRSTSSRGAASSLRPSRISDSCRRRRRNGRQGSETGWPNGSLRLLPRKRESRSAWFGYPFHCHIRRLQCLSIWSCAAVG